MVVGSNLAQNVEWVDFHFALQRVHSEKKTFVCGCEFFLFRINLKPTRQPTVVLDKRLFQYSEQTRLFVKYTLPYSAVGVTSGLQVYGTFKITSMLPPRKETTYCKQLFVFMASTSH